MGLGPPVCQHCQVIGSLLTKSVPVVRTEKTRTLNTHTFWICPVCGETDLQDHAGIIDADWKKYDDNLKFLKFVHGKSD